MVKWEFLWLSTPHARVCTHTHTFLAKVGIESCPYLVAFISHSEGTCSRLGSQNLLQICWTEISPQGFLCNSQSYTINLWKSGFQKFDHWENSMQKFTYLNSQDRGIWVLWSVTISVEHKVRINVKYLSV